MLTQLKEPQIINKPRLLLTSDIEYNNDFVNLNKLKCRHIFALVMLIIVRKVISQKSSVNMENWFIVHLVV